MAWSSGRRRCIGKWQQNVSERCVSARRNCHEVSWKVWLRLGELPRGHLAFVWLWRVGKGQTKARSFSTHEALGTCAVELAERLGSGAGPCSLVRTGEPQGCPEPELLLQLQRSHTKPAALRPELASSSPEKKKAPPCAIGAACSGIFHKPSLTECG